jgi:hypothetical protein
LNCRPELNAAAELYPALAEGVLGINHWALVRILDPGSPIALNNSE